MSEERLASSAAAYQHSAALIALFVLGFTAMTLAVQLLAPQPLHAPLHSLFVAKSDTALCSAILGFALYLASGFASGATAAVLLRRVAAFFALLIAGASLCSSSFGLGPGLAALLPGSFANTSTFAPGTMASTTALVFVLLSGALLLVPGEGRLRGLAEGLKVSALVLTGLTFLTIVYNLKPTRGFGSGAQTVPRTAVTLLLLCLGSIFLDPDRGLLGLLRSRTPAGGVTRRLMPAAIAVPILVGAAQMAGTRHGLYEAPYGLLFAVVIDVSVLSLFVVWSARSIGSLEEARRAREAELKDSEGEVRRKTELLNLTGEMAKVGGWEFDAATGAGTWTDEVARIHDLDPSVGTSVEFGLQFYTEDSRPRIEAAIRAATESAQPFDLELEIVSAKGVRKWVRTLGMPVVVWGKVTRVQGIFQDITARKTAEAMLQYKESTLRLFVEYSPASTAMFDRDMRYLLATRRWIESYRLQDREIIGKSHYEVFPEISEDWKAVYRRCLAGAVESRDDDPFPRADGSLDWVRWEVRPWYEAGGEIGGIIIFSDVVTKRKDAEFALRQSEERYRGLFENMVEGFAYCKMEYREGRPVDWTYLQVNPAFERLTGLTGASGQRVSELIPGIRESDPELFEIYGRVAATGKAERFEMEVKALHLWFSISVYSPVQEYFVAVFDVITERKLAEEEVNRQNADLEDRVRRRTEELEAANAELESFSYSVSHDLRAPLRGIDGWTGALWEEYAAGLDDTARDYLERIRTESKHMARLIDDLLQFSRVTRASLALSVVDLSSLALGASERARLSYSGRHIEVSVAPGLSARADAGLMEIVLFNLLDNAMKFTGPRKTATIEFGTTKQEGRSALFLRDNGVGFDMSYAKKLFSPFQRLHGFNEFPGTGIGLATVRRIVERHGGTIWVESRKNVGTTFFFTLGGDD